MSKPGSVSPGAGNVLPTVGASGECAGGCVPAQPPIRAVISVIERYWQVAAAQTQAWKTSW